MMLPNSPLTRLLRPRSVAVIGGREARRVAEQLAGVGYCGDVWPVHPRHAEVAGLRAYASVDDLPAAPDASFVGVNRQRTVDIVAALARRGAGGAVCYASGFKEAAHHDVHGETLQQALLDAAGGMPIIGPNCYGFINYLDRALLWPDQHGGQPLADGERGVALLTQSSNIAISLSMQQRGLPLAYLLTAGNQAQQGITQLGQGLLADPRVSVLAMHVEGIDDATAFHELCMAARRRRVPVVMLRVGRSERGRRSALTHTASIAGSAHAASAFFARCGVAEVSDLEALVETCKLLHHLGPLAGTRIASLSCSGGEAALMADTASRHGLDFMPLGTRQRESLAGILGARVHLDNPLDYHTYIWGQREALQATFEAMLRGGADFTALLLDYPRTDRCDDADWRITEDAFAAALQITGARGGVLATLPENLPEQRILSLARRGIPALAGLAPALAALRAAADIGAGRAGAEPDPPWRHLPPGGAERVLHEHELKLALAASAIPVPAGEVVDSALEACAAARRLGGEVAVKAMGLAHKSEHGGVRLGVRGDDAVSAAAAAMLRLSPTLRVERMLPAPVGELLVGVTQEPPYGWLLTLASGGVFTELLEDGVSLLLPATAGEIRAALARLRTYRLLHGFRNGPRGDVAAVAATLAAIVDFVAARRDTLLELEINPLLVCEDGQGAWAADALMRVRDTEQGATW
jgi:acyl-CoA synthetase (NDP forming)